MTEAFRLNKHGVCINPNVIEYRKGICSFKIKTAYIDGCWTHGYAFDAFSEYKGSPCCASPNYKGFDTEKEAIRHAAKVALDVRQTALFLLPVMQQCHTSKSPRKYSQS